MSKIPEWALAEARKIAISLNGFATPDDFQRIALALVEAERRGIERSVKAIQDEAAKPHMDGCSVSYAMDDIAAAIRQLAETDK